MYSSRGTGLTLGWKLKVQLVEHPNQLDKSFALAIDDPRAIILIGFSSCDEMYLMREQINSITGPSGPPSI